MAETPQIKLTDRVVPVLLVLVIGMAFALGVMWQKVSILETGGSPSKVAGAGDPTVPDSGNQAPPNGKLSEDQAKRIPPIGDDDHLKGNRDAQVFLIEYSDFECPFCSKFHPTAQQAVDEYGGKVAWGYRHFPLVSLHPNAQSGAEASECVFELGGDKAFWNFADKVFSVQDQGLSNEVFLKIAGEAGVSSDSVKTCLEGGKFKDKVADQQSAGETAGVTGTPGSFIVNKNGEAWLLPGAVPFENLKSVIEEAL